MRNNKGSNLIEGLVGIFMVIAGVLACTIFLANVTLLATYKHKLGMVANAAISKASRLRPGAFHTSQTQAQIEAQNQLIEALVNERLSALGLPAANEFSLTTDKRTGYQTIQVSFKVNGLQLIGIPGILPSQVSLNETTSVVLPCKIPPALFTLRFVGEGFGGFVGDAIMPSYGQFRAKFSSKNAAPEPAQLPKTVAAFRKFERRREQASFFCQNHFSANALVVVPERN